MNVFALRAGRMFDGSELHGSATVTVDEGKIAAVDTSGAAPSGGMRLIDLGDDTTLLPGLIDAHVHLGFDAGTDPVGSMRHATDEELLDQMRSAARRAVRAGVTTVRDLGDRDFLALTLRDELEKCPAQGPQILPAGPPITTVGGHCYFMGGEAEGAEALVAAVRERHARGCAVVKIMASGGNMTTGSAAYESQYSLAELRLVVEEAHRLGLPVAAHAHAPASIADAFAAGVDSIEHVTFITEDGIQADPDLVARLAASDTLLGLSIGMSENGALPPKIAERVAAVDDIVRSLIGLGAKIMPGSDAGVQPVKPHDVLVWAPAHLVRLGASPLQALTAVTSVAAQGCRCSDRKGRIAVGMDADLLAVNGNPVEDATRVRDTRVVFRAGVQVR